MFELPTSITIDNNEYLIRDDGDFRMVLDCFEALQDDELPKKERIITSVIIFYDALNLDNVFEIFDTQEKIASAVEQMFNFFNCNQNTIGNASSQKLIDWNQDTQLIASAVNKVANTEIRSIPYLHWWTFMGYYMSVGESTLSTVVGIRDKLVKGKKLEKHENEFRHNNPGYFVWNRSTVEEREADRMVRELWNKE